MTRTVLQLTRNLNVYGVSHYIRTLGRGLVKRGIRMGVAAYGVDGTYDRAWYEREGFSVLQIPGQFPAYQQLRKPSHWRDFLRALRAFNTIIDEFKPDVIQANSGQLAGVAYLCNALRRRPVPLVTCIHNDSGAPDKIRLGRMVNRFLPGAYGSRAIAISDEMVGFLTHTVGISPSRVRLVRLSIDEKAFRPPAPEERIEIRRRLGLAADAHVVCLIGQYVHRKGHDILIDAAALLRDRGHHIVMLCAGEHHFEAAYKAKLMQQARDRGVADQLILRGHSDPLDILWASDIGVLPSRQEGFGLVVAEGMSCGVVQIRTPAAGAKDTTIDGETGFLVPFDDPRALADRIQVLIEDHALYQRIRARSLEFAHERFAADRMVEDTLAVYAEIAG